MDQWAVGLGLRHAEVDLRPFSIFPAKIHLNKVLEEGYKVSCKWMGNKGETATRM